MLILSRKKDEVIVVGDNIEIRVIEIRGDQVRLGITAPADVKVFRKELYLQIQEENTLAAQTVSDLTELNKLIKSEKNMKNTEKS